MTSASASIEGLLGEDLLKKIHTDIAFVSARGFSVEDGLTDFSIYEADLKRMCIKASARTVALVDHTKSGLGFFIIPLFILGALAGFRNCYIVAKKIYESAGIELVIAE